MPQCDRARSGARVGSLSTLCKTSAAPPLIAASSPSSDPTISTTVGATAARWDARRARPEKPLRERAERSGQDDRRGLTIETAAAMQMPRISADLVEARDHLGVARERALGDEPLRDDVSLRVPWMPARRAIASWPTNVSRHPRPPQRHCSPSNGRTGM